MLRTCFAAPLRFEDPGGAIAEGLDWEASTSDREEEDVLEGEVPEGLPLVLADADPLEQLSVSERSGSERRQTQGRRRKAPARRR